jgi:hypothetical protein
MSSESSNELSNEPADEKTTGRLNCSEKQLVEINLGDFKWERSDGEKFLEAICPGKSLTLQDLKVIGVLCESLTRIKFDRDFSRDQGHSL